MLVSFGKCKFLVLLLPTMASALFFDRDACDSELACPENNIFSPNRWMMHRDDPELGCVSRCTTAIQKALGHWDCGDCSNFTDQVLPSDVTLVPPNGDGPIISSITAYNWQPALDFPDAQYELPIYQDLDRGKDEFWNFLLDELLLSRMDLILLHGRGCHDKDPGSPLSERGTGSMCPRLLKGFVDAVERAGVEDVIRVGMWDDTGMYRTARNFILKTNDTQFDVGNETNWQFFWDYNIKIWFDTIPQKLWYLIDGKPVITNWNLRDNKFKNQQGNASRLLAWLKAQFLDRYGVEPYFVVEETWISEDSTITTNEADGKHGWFNPLQESYTYETYNNEEWGVVVPSFRNADTFPGCGMACREVLRYGGKTLRQGFEAGRNAKLIMHEGWTNMAETSGVYRSNDWTFPTQYINIVREYSDPEPETLLLQAEGADAFEDTTPENIGGQYANRSLDVGALDDNTGWYVGWTEPGEWLEYKEVKLGCGLYRFSARAASTMETGARMRLALGSLPSIPVDGTGGSFDLVHLGEIQLTATGKYDLRIVFETESIDLDWFFVKRVNKSCTSHALRQASPGGATMI